MKILLAGPEHERQLRELMCGSPMPGWVRVAFGRDPDFFQAIGIQGKMNQVLIALEQDRVMGMGCRSIKPLWVNGEIMDFGYLGGLRLHPAVRRTGLLARGYTALGKLHEAQPAAGYLTTIIEDNVEARNLLASGRAGLPHYLDYGRYVTCAIHLKARRRKYKSPFEIQTGSAVGMKAILEFLAREGSRRQFFPAIDADDFGGGGLRGLRVNDFRVAFNGRRKIVGMAAVWDLNDFRQTIIHGYSGPVRLLRPIINGALRLAGFRALPPQGERINTLHIAFACARGDDPQIMRALLERIYAERQKGPHHFLLWGLHERDPLAAAAHPFPVFHYFSRVYLVYWNNGMDFIKCLDATRIPHLELATL